MKRTFSKQTTEVIKKEVPNHTLSKNKCPSAKEVKSDQLRGNEVRAQNNYFFN